MRKKYLIALVLCLGTIFASQALLGQPNYYIPIQATDNILTLTVKIGLHQDATYGVEDVVFGVGDTVKEFELPVPPIAPGPLDFRVLDLDNRPRGGAGQQYDIRRSLGNPVQCDTFQLSFLPSNDISPSDRLTLTWPDNLASYGYRGFKLVPLGDGLTEEQRKPIDMTLQSSYSYPILDTLTPKSVYVIIGDGRMFRTFESDSIGLAVDYKGKQKAEKRKNYACDFTATFTNTNAQTAARLVVKFSMNINEWLSTVNLETPVTLPSKGPFTFIVNVGQNQSYAVSGIGGKGKAIAAKGAIWKSGAGIQIGNKFDGVCDSRLMLRMPNINNIGEEIYSQAGNVDPVNGIILGVYGATNKCVIHPKWKQVMKTVWSKDIGTHKGGTPACFDTYAGGEFKAKPMKSYEPKKQKNELIGELMALKVNLLASKAGKTPTGLGAVVYSEEGSPFDGQTLDSIAAKADQFLTYCLSEIKSVPYTAAELKALLSKINGTFSAAFDSATFGNPSGTKAQGTSLDGVIPILMVDYLYRTSGFIPPVNNAKYQIEQTPAKFELMQNYPNPFNPTTNIQFNLEEDAFVTVKIYNMLGQEVRTLVNREEFIEGENEIEFDASGLASGVYYYRLTVNDGKYSSIKKMMLIK